MKQILVATKNEGKLQEFEDLLQELEIEWLGLTAVGITDDVEETGTTFYENACLKAQAYAQKTGLMTLADDSGLVVDALAGVPGVKTARFGGPGLTSEDRYRLLLQKLEGVPPPERTARFCCSIVVASGDGRVLASSEGVCEGIIAQTPRGDGGFGYDPIFFLPQKGKTMAELLPDEKHKISHRGQAIKNIKRWLKESLDD